MRAAGYGDRVYGRALTSGGKTWLQYWLFSYYNPQNVLGFGVHEGDWEFVQVGLDADGVPDVATYAQHGGGERCGWSQVQKSGGAPVVVRRARVARVVLLVRREPARLLPRRLPPRRRLPGPARRWRSSRRPRRSWRGGAGGARRRRARSRRDARASGALPTPSTPSRRRARSERRRRRRPRRRCEQRPRSTSRRSRRRARARSHPWRYELDTRPATLVVSVAEAGDPDVAAARRVRVGRRTGVVELRLPPGSAGPYVVSASAFSERGARSPIVRARLR